jgi:glucokinase
MIDKTYLGVEIGGTKLQFVAGDATGGIRQRWRFSVAREHGGAGIRAQIEKAIPELMEAKPVAIGVGFGGPVEWRSGTICRSHQIEGWSGFGLRDWLGALTGRPVVVENDANTGALGEALGGAGAGGNPVFYTTLGSGVGGGLVVDRRVYHGATPGEAEIGHLRLDREGTVVEARCSGWSVDARIRQLKLTDPASLLCKWTTTSVGGEARFLARACGEGDPAALRLLRETAGDLAFALSHVTHLFHPEVIVLGGGLALVGEVLRAAVEDRLRSQVMEAFAPGPRVCLAAFAEDAVPVGALFLAAGLAP